MSCIDSEISTLFMRRTCTYIVLIALGVQTNGAIVSWLLFSGNRTNIVATCCERRTRNCNGSCFLSKSIEQEHQSRETRSQVIVVFDSNFDALIESTTVTEPASSLILHCPSLLLAQCRTFPLPSRTCFAAGHSGHEIVLLQTWQDLPVQRKKGP